MTCLHNTAAAAAAADKISAISSCQIWLTGHAKQRHEGLSTPGVNTRQVGGWVGNVAPLDQLGTWLPYPGAHTVSIRSAGTRTAVA
jgi:hypothetical protein